MTHETLLYPPQNQEINLLIADKLESLVIEQRQDFEKGDFMPKSVTNRKGVLQWFEQSERFREIYTKAINFYLLPRTDREIDEIKDYFSGEIFEDMAYCFLAGKQSRDRILYLLDT